LGTDQLHSPIRISRFFKLIMESDQVMIQDAEDFFLARNFKDSLLCCNKILYHPSSLTNTTTTTTTTTSGSSQHSSSHSRNQKQNCSLTTINLKTPLVLRFDSSQQTRTISVQIPVPTNDTTEKKSAEKEDDDDDDDDGDTVAGTISFMDRAGTVALQSWYEIARSLEESRTDDNQKQIGKQQRQGHVHLLPFLNAYTTAATTTITKKTEPTQDLPLNSNPNTTESFVRARPIPLELAVVFVRFLRTSVVGHSHESLELSCELLYRILMAAGNNSRESNKAPLMLSSYVWSCCEDLFHLVFVETLPFLTLQNSVSMVLKRFISSSRNTIIIDQGNNDNDDDKKEEEEEVEETWTTVTEPLIVKDEANSNSILLILLFFNQLPPNWSRLEFPSLNCLEGCRNDLDQMLRMIKLQKDQAQQQSQEDEFLPRNGSRRIRFADDVTGQSAENKSERASIVPVPSRTGSTSDNQNNSILMIYARLVEISSEIIQTWKGNKSTVAFILLLMVLIWRKRHRVSSVSTRAVRLFLAPFREIVDAILKPS